MGKKSGEIATVVDASEFDMDSWVVCGMCYSNN